MKIRTVGGKILIHTGGGYPPVNDIGYDPNGKESKKVSEVGILKKDPETNREQIEKLEMMKADGGLDKARKHEKIIVDTSYLVSKKRKESSSSLSSSSSSSSSSSPDPCPTYLGPAFVKKVPSKGEAPVQPPWTTTETDNCRESGESEMFTARGPRIPLPSSSVASSLSKSELKEGRLASPPPPHPPPPSLPDSGELASANDDTTLPPSLPLPPLPAIPPKPATDSGQPFLPPQPSGPPPPKQPPTLTARAAFFPLPPQSSGPPPPKQSPALTFHATLLTLLPSPKSTQPSPAGMGKSEREKVHDSSSDIRNPKSNLASAVHTPPSPPPKLPPMLANHQSGGAPSQSTGANDAFRKIQPTLPGVGLPNRSFKPPPPQKTTLPSRTTPSSSRPTKTVITSLSAEWRRIDMEAVRSILLLAKSHMNGFIARSQGRDRAIEGLVERIRKRLLMYEFPTNDVDAFFEEWRGHMATFERLSARDEEAIVTEERAQRLKEVQEQATKAQSERDTCLQRREFFKDNSRVAAEKLKAAEDRVSKLKHLLEEARKTVVIYKKVVQDLEQETSTANAKLQVAEKSVADKTSQLKLVADNIEADSKTRAIHQQRLEEVKIDILACIQAFFESAWVKSFIQA